MYTQLTKQISRESGFVYAATALALSVLLLLAGATIQIMHARNEALYVSYIGHQIGIAAYHNRGHPQDALNSAAAAARLFGFNATAPLPAGENGFDTDGDGSNDTFITYEYVSSSTLDDYAQVTVRRNVGFAGGLFNNFGTIEVKDRVVASGGQTISSVYFDNSTGMNYDTSISELLAKFGIADADNNGDPDTLGQRNRLPFFFTRLRWVPNGVGGYTKTCRLQNVAPCGMGNPPCVPLQDGQAVYSCPGDINCYGRVCYGTGMDLDTVNAPRVDNSASHANRLAREPWLAPVAPNVTCSVGGQASIIPDDPWETTPDWGCGQKAALQRAYNNSIRAAKEATGIFLDYLRQTELGVRVALMGAGTSSGAIVEHPGGIVELCDGTKNIYSALTQAEMDNILTVTNGSSYTFTPNINLYPGPAIIARMIGQVSPRENGGLEEGWTWAGTVTNWNNSWQGHKYLAAPPSNYYGSFSPLNTNPVGAGTPNHLFDTGFFPVRPLNTGGLLYVPSGDIVIGGTTYKMPGYYEVNPTTGLRESPDPTVGSPDWVNPTVSSSCASLFNASLPSKGGLDLAAALIDAKNWHQANAGDKVPVSYFITTGVPGTTAATEYPTGTTPKTSVLTTLEQLNSIETTLDEMEDLETNVSILIYLENMRNEPAIQAEKNRLMLDFEGGGNRPWRYLSRVRRYDSLDPTDTPQKFRERLIRSLKNMVLLFREVAIYSTGG